MIGDSVLTPYADTCTPGVGVHLAQARCEATQHAQGEAGGLLHETHLGGAAYGSAARGVVDQRHLAEEAARAHTLEQGRPSGVRLGGCGVAEDIHGRRVCLHHV